MQKERRSHLRFSLQGVPAHITIARSVQDDIEVEGHVLDISYKGIKIRLESPLPKDSEGFLEIVLNLPESNIPVTIRGEIRHLTSDCELGLLYLGSQDEDILDELMFECVKLTNIDYDSDAHLKFI